MTTTIYNADSEPLYKVSAFTFTEIDMGEASITCDIYLDKDVDPQFSLTWYMDYKGERFYLSTLQPPAIKDNSSTRYKYSLTFKSEREDLKRYEMLDLVKSNEGDPIPDKYSFSFQGDITQFVDRFNANIEYNFGSRWEMRLASGVTSESVIVSCQDGVTLWSLLTQVYDLYGVRWYIAAEGDKMVIFVGYKPTEISHIFEYDPDKDDTTNKEEERGGLYSIERVNPLSDIYTRLRGTGGTRNIPYRYFRPQSQVDSEKQYPADPDYNSVIANNNYSNLMPKCFRDYLKGWNGTALSPETPAYQKGKADKASGKFIPVDYVTSDKESKWGVKYGSLQANEEIYPTIQGVWDDNLGRLDEIVAVSEVLEDADNTTSSEDLKYPVCDNIWFNTEWKLGGISQEFTASSPEFTVEHLTQISGYMSAVVYNINWVSITNDAIQPYLTYMRLRNMETGDMYDMAAPNTPITSETGFCKAQVPPGTYKIELSCHTTVQSYAYYKEGRTTFTFANIEAWTLQSETETDASTLAQQTFQIWIKDVGFDIRESKYWAVGQGDMAVMFSDGWLAGEDYEFTIAAEKSGNTYTKIYVEEDNSKSIYTQNKSGQYINVPSKWRITLIRSDAEYEASGRMLPNSVVNAKAGDHFYFVNIQLPQKYVEWAEERLQEYMETELSKVDDEYPTFTVKPSAIFCAKFDEAEQLRAGARIRIRNQRLIGDGYLVVYVSSLTLTHSSDKNLPTWDMVVSETPSAGQNAISLLQGQVEQLTQNVYSSRTALAEAVAQMDRIFLRGDGIPDTSYSPTTFTRDVTVDGNITTGGNIMSKDFASAGFAGSGYGIYKDENGATVLEIDKVVARRELVVNKATINQIEFLYGKYIYSRGGIVVTSVEEVADGYKVFFDTNNGDTKNPFVVGDLAYSSNFNSADSAIVKYYWAEVTEVGTDYVVLSATEKDGEGVPMAGDNLAQLGNTSDPNRQAAFIIDQTVGGMNVQYTRLGDSTAEGGKWSFTDRAQVGFGYDTETKRAKLFCYGDAYIGDRDLKKGQYITFQKKEGSDEYAMYFAGTAYFGAGSSGLTNLSEWPEKQQQITGAQDTANSAQQTASDAQQTANAAQQAADEASRKAQEAKDYIDNTLPGEIAAINAKLDGVVESWFYPYTPTLENEPAATWIQNGEEAAHQGDTFTNTQAYVDEETTPDAGKSWRWVESAGTWGWTPIADSDAVKALQQAAKAQDTADSKRRVFVVQPTTPYDVGDLWSQGSGGDIMRCIKARSSGSFDASDWDKASKYTDDTAANKAQQTADDAKEEAQQNTAKLTKWASDGYISPTEKTGLKQQQANIRSEYNQILFEAQRYSVSTVVYEVSYTKADEALTKYTASSPEEIPVESDYTNIAVYYSDRQSVLDAISAKVKEQVDAAAQAAADAQSAAEAAQKDATANKELLTKWSSDSYISPTEKTALKQQQADIQAEYTEIVSQAGLYGISISNYSTAYSKAMSAFTKYTAASPSEIAIGTDYANIAAYYTARQTILNNIAAAAKSLVDSVDTAVSNLEYLKTVFAKDETVIAGGAVIGSFVGVKNDSGTVVAGLAGKDFLTKSGAATLAADLTCPMFFAGATSATAANSASFRVYADGHVFANKMTLEEGCVVGGFEIKSAFISTPLENSYYPLTLYASGLIDARRTGSGSVPGFTYFGCTDGSPFVETTDGKYAGLAMYSNRNTTLAGIIIDMEDAAPAIEIRGGYVRGFRRYTKDVSYNYTLSNLDDVIVFGAAATRTITLPSNPDEFQEYEIYKIFGGTLNINGNGNTVRRLGFNEASSVQLTTNSGVCIRLKWHSVRSTWYLSISNGKEL